MCDTPEGHATFEDGDPPTNISRPTTPLPDSSRMPSRTISCTSVDTVRPSRGKLEGIRRCIEEIAENLKQMSTKKKRKHSSMQDVPKNEASDVESRSETLPNSKTTKRRRKVTAPLRPEEKNVLSVADSSIPSDFELDPPLTFPGRQSDSPVDVPLFKEKEDHVPPTRILRPGAARVTTAFQDTFRPIPKINIKDVQLDIRPSETSLTIWDGLQAPYHVFKCRLVLRCTTHPYGAVSLPNIRRIEMECSTRPVGSHYVRPPVLQATYAGAALGKAATLGVLPNVDLAAGIHMDRAWCKMQDDDDGTWGWYRTVFVPLSPRLFDKMDYREFKLVSRVWVGESCVAGELTFGISMLLREVDMK